MIYYVNHNVCNTLEDAEEVQDLYRAAGEAADILTGIEYFDELQNGNLASCFITISVV